MRRIKELVVALVRAFADLCGAVIDLLAVVPSKLFSSWVGRVKALAEASDQKAEERKNNRERKELEEKLNKAFSQLMLTDDLLSHAQASSRYKKYIIFGLELVSFPTTYRGLLQAFAALGPWIPMVLALVIQAGLAFLANGAFSHHSPRSHRFLVVLFLVVSVFFSYLGVAESMIAYEEHLRKGYEDFRTVWEVVLDEASGTVSNEGNPAAVLTAQRDRALAYVEDALADEPSAQKLDDMRAEAEELSKMTRTETYDNGEYTIRDQNGKVIKVSKGQSTKKVPNEDAREKGALLSERIDLIEKMSLDANALKLELETRYSEDAILAVLNAQLAADEVTPAYTKLEADLQLLAEKVNKLEVLRQKVEAMGSQSYDAATFTAKVKNPVAFELTAELAGYRSYSAMKAVEQMPDFVEVCANLNGRYDFSILGNKYVQFFLEPFMKNVPLDVMDEVVDEVEKGYQSLTKALAQSKNIQSQKKLDEAYQEFVPQHPFDFCMQPLLAGGEKKLLAVIALIIAAAVDGIAVIVGIFFDIRKPDWFARKTFTRWELAPFSYDQFRSVVLPIITERMGSTEPTRSHIYAVFAEYIRSFLEKFDICHALRAEGFVRCAAMEKFSKLEDHNLLVFFSSKGMVEIITGREAKELNVPGAVENCEYVLLSLRADALLREMLGNACEIKNDKTPAAV